MNGQFVISLDFELLWGVRDHADRDTYGKNVLGARDAVPKMLELFAENEISATWATVGFLFCETKEELLASLPSELPTYSNPRLSNLSYKPMVYYPLSALMLAGMPAFWTRAISCARCNPAKVCRPAALTRSPLPKAGLMPKHFPKAPRASPRTIMAPISKPSSTDQ